MEAATEDPTSLRAEIERLTRELDEASSDKIQSAQYGLALLEEKEALSKRCEELEAAYENSKHDLIITSEVGVLTIYNFRSQCNVSGWIFIWTILRVHCIFFENSGLI